VRADALRDILGAARTIAVVVDMDTFRPTPLPQSLR